MSKKPKGKNIITAKMADKHMEGPMAMANPMPFGGMQPKGSKPKLPLRPKKGK